MRTADPSGRKCVVERGDHGAAHRNLRSWPEAAGRAPRGPWERRGLAGNPGGVFVSASRVCQGQPAAGLSPPGSGDLASPAESWSLLPGSGGQVLVAPGQAARPSAFSRMGCFTPHKVELPPPSACWTAGPRSRFWGCCPGVPRESEVQAPHPAQKSRGNRACSSMQPRHSSFLRLRLPPSHPKHSVPSVTVPSVRWRLAGNAHTSVRMPLGP